MFTSFRTAVIAAAFSVGAVAYSSAASAQFFTYQGTTTGAFNGGVLGPAAALPPGLTFASGAFLVNSLAVVGATADIGNAPAGNNLGTFSLTTANAVYTGATFQLAVSFSLPAGTLPNPGTFNAVLNGSVTTIGGTSAGGVLVDFNNAPIVFTFPQGQFTLEVSDTNITPGGSGVPITGRITVTAVPAPVAGAALPVLLGMAGIWFARRRQNRTA